MKESRSQPKLHEPGEPLPALHHHLRAKYLAAKSAAAASDEDRKQAYRAYVEQCELDGEIPRPE